MRFYEKYLKKKEIINRAKKHGFPQPWLVELFVYDFEILQQLLEISENFVLKGGAAVQLYLPVDQQRASVDIDIITNLKPIEVEKIFMNQINNLGFANVKMHKPKKPEINLPLATYLIDLPSAVRKDKTLQLKVDILFENTSSYKIENIENKELFALKINNQIPCIRLGSLIADKFLTLASKSVGIDKIREGQLSKHVYDLGKLIDLIKKEDFNDILFSFERLALAEMSFRKIKYKLSEIIGHIDETLSRFTKIDMGGAETKKLVIDFQSAYVSKGSRTRLQKWIIDCLRLRCLLKIIGEVIIGGKNREESYKKFAEYEKELENISNLEAKNKKELKNILLNEARKKIKSWKLLKGKSEERIFLELKLFAKMQ